ncbi:MAG TPA: methyltransferase domain-containing protein [Blastococcus sp.]|nr:methyltransferase domain-containing protein [Blastococcus sp.]
MTSSTGTAADADRALKAKHRSMWASGDYPGLAADLLGELGDVLVAACGVQPGDRVLDIAAGSGNIAVPAARTGASVVASDLTPELFEAGRARAAAEGVELEWREADAEALPFADGEFDVVLSAIGVMFAPHHQAAADELVRVCKPGGRIGLISWTPEGFIGQMFATMKPYAPPPPPGASPPPLWGREEHVRELLGDRVTDVSTERRLLSVERFGAPEDFRDYFKARYGPTIAVYRSLADQPERAAELDAQLAELARRMDRGKGATVVDWEYLLLTATKKRETVPGPR